MQQKIRTPRQSLLKGFITLPVSKEDIGLFKQELQLLADRIKIEESEEYNKNLIMQFLNRTYYVRQGYMVNTYGKTDMAIYTDSAEGRKPVVLFEFKGPGRPDMISTSNFRKKALYELVLYYLREEVKQSNHDIKHLVITDCRQFFIFDKSLFYRLFASNRKWVKSVIEADDSPTDHTEYIYNELIAPMVAQVESRITCTYLNLEDLKRDLRPDAEVTPRLVAAYKILSPTHLMRLPFSSDHNTLNAKFYQELLYIMGLQEVTEKNKKVIGRLDEAHRQHYSLMEQACCRLADYDDITDGQQLFDKAIGITLLWINRVLFLKLLESQLVAFNGSTDYTFLNIGKIPDYDVLNDLFREVLARPEEEREEKIKAYFALVPYLNSSLFEISALEQHYFSISGLRAGKVELFERTVLTDAHGHRLSGQINELEYLFRFLDAFDFGETGRTQVMIAERSKALIDASVLGLIFEKINGYKDGSIFTPGYITQHICETAIRQAVVEQFNRKKGWHCQTLEEVEDHLEPLNRETRTEANNIVNSLRICDPAVGSGHFLVSALNTLIALKSEMGILQDHSEKPKPVNAWNITIENDELVMRDEDGELFAYHPKDKESQRVQTTLFEEKKSIIENCLFGVDLNPKSVEICQLRLWIELLKSAYYVGTGDSGRTLRTLPNIDINIRCGDSLASRRMVAVGKKVVAGQGLAKVIDSYKKLVRQYVNCHSKQLKKEIRAQIRVIKTKLNPPIDQDLFGGELNQRQSREARVLGRSLEWMIEFPEVLDEEGHFLGFDVVIGNPPYINTQEMKDETQVYAKMRNVNADNTNVKAYSTLVPRADVYALFVERGLQLLRRDGILSFILPNKWEKVMYGEPLRKLFLQHDLQSMVDFGDNQVFPDATTYTCIINLRKRASGGHLSVSNIRKINDDDLGADIEQNARSFDLSLFSDAIWHTQSLEGNRKIAEITANKDRFTTLEDAVGKESYRGILTGLSKAFLISQSTYDELVNRDASSRGIIRPFLSGSGLAAYRVPRISNYLIFTPKGFTLKGMQCEPDDKPTEEEAWQWFAGHYPAVAEWLAPFKAKAEVRTDKGDYWWELRACAYYDKFAEPKIMYQAFQTKPCFIFRSDAIFCNNSMFFVSVNDRRLLALLNSSVGWWLISEYCPRIRNGYQLIWENLGQIPVPRQLPEELNALAKEAEEAAADDASLSDSVRRTIDEVVRPLYGIE